ncbi:hypothetical protein BSKO_12132 [Bryopsis sp. KO-2023]|nr:hypothetical protein BSKO_12132 [Bryopsis sp. KO-2023]
MDKLEGISGVAAGWAGGATAAESLRVPGKKFAWVALVMGLDLAYVGAALVLGSALKRRSKRADVVVMVTRDVPQDARDCLARVFDSVVEVPYLQTLALQKYSERFDSMYNYWLDKCFTKFAMFSLTQYSKVIFLDADMLAVEEPDDLFDCPAPAGICSAVRDVEENERLHGNRLPRGAVEESLRNGLGRYGIRGCLLVVEPEYETYAKIRGMVKGVDRYGSLDSMVGPDEYLITRFYADKWSHIHAKYGWVSWADREELGVDPVFLHYVSQKPWDEGEEWDDFDYWKKEAGELVKEVPESICYFGRLMDDISKLAQVPVTPEDRKKAEEIKKLSQERRVAEKARREGSAANLGVDLTSTSSATPHTTPRDLNGMWRPLNSARAPLVPGPSSTTPRVAPPPLPLSARGAPSEEKKKAELIVKANSNILVVHGFKRPYPSKPREEKPKKSSAGKGDGARDSEASANSAAPVKPSKPSKASKKSGKSTKPALGLELGTKGTGTLVPRLNLATLNDEDTSQNSGSSKNDDPSGKTWMADHWRKRHGGDPDTHRSAADLDDNWRMPSARVATVADEGDAPVDASASAAVPNSARPWRPQQTPGSARGQAPPRSARNSKYQRWENPPKSSRADEASSWRTTPRGEPADSTNSWRASKEGDNTKREMHADGLNVTPRGEMPRLPLNSTPRGDVPPLAPNLTPRGHARLPPSHTPREMGRQAPLARTPRNHVPRQNAPHMSPNLTPRNQGALKVTPRNLVPRLSPRIERFSPRDFRNDPPANGPYSARNAGPATANGHRGGSGRRGAGGAGRYKQDGGNAPNSARYASGPPGPSGETTSSVSLQPDSAGSNGGRTGSGRYSAGGRESDGRGSRRNGNRGGSTGGNSGGNTGGNNRGTFGSFERKANRGFGGFQGANSKDWTVQRAARPQT